MTGLVEMHMDVDHARKHKQSPGVDLLETTGEFRPDSANHTVLDSDVGWIHAFRRHDGSTANDDISTADLAVHALDALKFDKPEYTAHAGEISIGYTDDGSGVIDRLGEALDRVQDRPLR